MGYELDAIAAVVIGDTRLAGGQGSITGTIIGTLLIGILTNTLRLNASSVDQTVAAGIALPSITEPSSIPSESPLRREQNRSDPSSERISYPRSFSRRQLAQIAFPLGGIGTGSIVSAVGDNCVIGRFTIDRTRPFS